MWMKINNETALINTDYIIRVDVMNDPKTNDIRLVAVLSNGQSVTCVTLCSCTDSEQASAAMQDMYIALNAPLFHSTNTEHSKTPKPHPAGVHHYE